MSQPEPINKPLVGIIGVVCLLGAAVCWIFYPEQTSLRSALLRVGVVMTALYLALPKPGDSIRWERLTPVLALAIVLMAFGKRMFIMLPILAVLGVVVTFLRPRSKYRPPRPNKPSS